MGYYRLAGDPARKEPSLKDVVTALVSEGEGFSGVEFQTASAQSREAFVWELKEKIKNRGWTRRLMVKPPQPEQDLDKPEVFRTPDKPITASGLLRAWSFRHRMDKFSEGAKDNLGFDQDQVRSDRAIRRHGDWVGLRYRSLIYPRESKFLPLE
ncbi:MAG: hypothetical protein L0Y56_19915 [Nitrospira sp.]|nr:hypothetical protein [Nitrospira sp.]